MFINFNHLKTFFSALINKMKGFRGNWNQNDPTADDYIKNRTHYTEIGEVVVLPLTTLTSLEVELQRPLVEGQTYTITWDGVTYESVAREYEGYIMVGNNAIYSYDDGIETDTGEPFALEIEQGDTVAYIYVLSEPRTLDSDGSEVAQHTISIIVYEEVIHKLDNKFIDMPDGIVTEDILYETLENELAPVAFTNNYDSLSGRPSVYTKDEVAAIKGYVHTGSWSSISFDYNNKINRARIDTVKYTLYKVSDVFLRKEAIVGEKYTMTYIISSSSYEFTISEDICFTLAAYDGDIVIVGADNRIVSARRSGTFNATIGGSSYVYDIPEPGTYFADINGAYISGVRFKIVEESAVCDSTNLTLESSTEGSSAKMTLSISDDLEVKLCKSNTYAKKYLADTTYVDSAINTAVSKSPIIPSSTEGSTKKFKIAIDDNGTITAIPV